MINNALATTRANFCDVTLLICAYNSSCIVTVEQMVLMSGKYIMFPSFPGKYCLRL